MKEYILTDKKMKRVLVPLVLAFLVFASCSKEKMDPDMDRVEICLGADVVSTKASVNSLTDLSETGARVGIYAVSAPWTAMPLMQNVQTTAIHGKSGLISWEDIYHYPADGSNLTFYGYYPYTGEGTDGDNYMTAPDGAKAPVLHFTTDGRSDIMYAEPVTAHKNTASVEKLIFRHVLTQLRFLARKGTVAEGTTIKSITLKQANSRCTLDMADGSLGSWSHPSTMVVLSDAEVTIPEVAEEIEGSEPLMIQPGVSQILIDVVTSKDGSDERYENITGKLVGTGNTFEAGVSYAITLTFNSKSDWNPIVMVVGMTSWDDSGKGTGTVE